MNDIPAFPRPFSGTKQFAQEGMTLRDYFAAQVLAVVYAKNWDMFMDYTIESPEEAIESAAKDAYGLADAMLKARQA